VTYQHLVILLSEKIVSTLIHQRRYEVHLLFVSLMDLSDIFCTSQSFWNFFGQPQEQHLHKVLLIKPGSKYTEERYPRLVHIHNGEVEIRCEGPEQLEEIDQITIIVESQQMGWCDMGTVAERNAMYAAAKAVAKAQGTAAGLGCLLQSPAAVLQEFQSRIPSPRQIMPIHIATISSPRSGTVSRPMPSTFSGW
jgi:hypothetical protein